MPRVSLWVRWFRLTVAAASPAASFQTVHAVLLHTAFRHHSSPCMRSPPACRRLETVDLKVTKRLPVEAA